MGDININYNTLIGNNIVLRKAKYEDYEKMLKNVWSDRKIYEWMLFTPTYTEQEAIARVKRSIEYQKNHYSYFVALKGSDEPIGLAAMYEYEPNKFEECGICVATKYQGLGYGYEILGLLLDLAFNKLEANSFRYGFFSDNMKSKKLAMKYGFKYEKAEEIIRQWDDEKRVVVLMTLSKDDYIKIINNDNN